MNLKEAFTYQNFYDRILAQVREYFSATNSTYITTFTHLKSAVNPEAEDVVVVDTQTEKLPYTVDTIIAFAMDVLKEKEKMYMAIRKAKESVEFDIDSAIGINKERNYFCNVLKNSLYSRKECEHVSEGRDYKFNVNGEQVPYTYKINEKITLEYDKKKIKKIIKELEASSNENSKQVDLMNVNLQVDIIPKYTLDMDLEDCLECFMTGK